MTVHPRQEGRAPRKALARWDGWNSGRQEEWGGITSGWVSVSKGETSVVHGHFAGKFKINKMDFWFPLP